MAEHPYPRHGSPNPGSVSSQSTHEVENPMTRMNGPFHVTFQPQQPPDHTNMTIGLSDDEGSGNIDREYTGVFEGPEKTLEVFFRNIGGSHAPATTTCTTRTCNTLSASNERVGLRSLSRHDLDRICRRARCSILSGISNQYVDAYVLSESSLFVYPYMVMLKTCGATTLLRCMAVLIELGKRVGLEIDWVGYSRKNFNFPDEQAFPHTSFSQEMEYLYSHKRLCDRLDGNGYTLGPVTGDHWFVFVADQTHRSTAADVDTDRVLNIMMFDIDEAVGDLFQYHKYLQNGAEEESKEDEIRRISRQQTIQSGINALCPGAMIDARAFEPCGYSMNAILYRSYSTIHITPESGSSYVSFETNQKLLSYKPLINNVIRTFRPHRFVMTLMADEGGLKEMKENLFTCAASEAKLAVAASPTSQRVYKRSSLASIKVEDDCCCMMGNWQLESDPSREKEYWERLRAEKQRGMSVS